MSTSYSEMGDTPALSSPYRGSPRRFESADRPSSPPKERDELFYNDYYKIEEATRKRSVEDELNKTPKLAGDHKREKFLDEQAEEIYVVRQKFGVFAILFSLAQCVVLALMMWQCGIAPMNLNPMYGPYPDALSEWGGKNAVLILEDHQVYRLLSPILLHAGVIHLICNVAVQLEMGVLFEQEWGSATWLAVYVLSAIGSSILSVICMPDAVSVGSSGAVMGLFGAKLSEVCCRYWERTRTKQERVGRQVRKEQCVGVTCSVLVVLAFSFIPFVDWAAHLGGLLAGMSVGFVLFSYHMRTLCCRLTWLLVGGVMVILYFVTTLAYMYSGRVVPAEQLRDVCGYYQQYYDDYECNCMREEYFKNGGEEDVVDDYFNR